MKCAVIAIGDELITGKVVDENSAWISDRLMEIGVPTAMHLTVADEIPGIIDAFRLAGERADLVIVTGGLGPTEDDMTRDAFCKFAGVGAILSEPALEQIKGMFRMIGREMTGNNVKQAMVPAGSELIRNPVGTAPGFAMKVGRAAYRFLPGVPRECKVMMEDGVLPALAALVTGSVFRTRLFRTFGMTESQLDQTLSGIALPEGVKLGYRAVFPEIHLKLIARGEDEKRAMDKLAAVEAEVRKRVGQVIYSDDGRGLEEVVLDLMRGRGLKLAVAESCTGGLIVKRLTDVPGSSDVLDRGFITYSNRAKSDLLGVDPELIKKHGAVSSETARAMALGALKRSDAQVALAVTGIAGPAGGTADRPVGTVHMAIADQNGVWENRFLFARADRTWVRELTAQAALEIIRRRVAGLDEFKR
ncbi:MAG TPA: competence/damage-inducible protein A [bacterium]|nr:competence/damage-inducible protein A [bacterium]